MTENRPDYRRFLWIAFLLTAAVAALTVDVPIARAFSTWNGSRSVASWLGYFNMFEFFGHGFGVVVLLVALHQLDPGRRWAIPRVAACALAAGCSANLIKMLIHRTRPYECALEGTVWDTFGACLPIFSAGSPGQSFPSAHTATAVGFAAALTWLYPQGRLLFSVLAVLVACQRVVCEAHYLSDVLIGAAAGLFMAGFFLQKGRLSAWFGRREEGWRQSPSSSTGTDGTS